jgi:ubiquinone/menaquinone biosynthesis C-methylase UbiE
MVKGKEESSWEGVSSWYQEIVGDKGHYYHENVIMPRLKDLFKQHLPSSILDLACGQGVLARQLHKGCSYLGVDASSSLIAQARRQSSSKDHSFIVADLSKKVALTKDDFDAATIILALQNIQDPLSVIHNAANHLKKGGRFYIILNHPCFRIPRQSSWMVDELRKIQYRRIDTYMSSLKIPIQAHPSKGGKSAMTLSFHRSLSDYFHLLKVGGFFVEDLHEWCSDKTSTGSKAKMENRARNEIPLFLAIVAIKL